jgi:Fur family transcriptional regulator, ferric uptake regulator
MSEVELHDVVAQRLRHLDQRYTGGRRAVVEVLAAATDPLTIPQILSCHDGLAQSSAYRNLSVLEEAGVVHRIVTSDDHARFELAEELTGEHHHHLVCTICGTVLDVTLPATLERHLDEALRQAAEQRAFTADHHRVDLIGTCGACA